MLNAFQMPSHFNPVNKTKSVLLFSPFYRLKTESQGHAAGIQPQQSAQGLTPSNSIPCLLHSSHAVESLKTSVYKRVKHSVGEKLEEVRTCGDSQRGNCTCMWKWNDVSLAVMHRRWWQARGDLLERQVMLEHRDRTQQLLEKAI